MECRVGVQPPQRIVQRGFGANRESVGDEQEHRGARLVPLDIRIPVKGVPSQVGFEFDAGTVQSGQHAGRQRRDRHRFHRLRTDHPSRVIVERQYRHIHGDVVGADNVMKRFRRLTQRTAHRVDAGAVASPHAVGRVHDDEYIQHTVGGGGCR